MNWLIKLYESEYFIIGLLTVIAILTILFILVAMLGKKKDKIVGEDNNADEIKTDAIAFTETNESTKLEVETDQLNNNLNPNMIGDTEILTGFESFNDEINPDNNQPAIEPFEEVQPLEKQTSLNPEYDAFSGAPAFGNLDFTITPRTTEESQQEKNLDISLEPVNVFNDQNNPESSIEHIESQPLEIAPVNEIEPILINNEEGLAPTLDINTEPVYNPEIDNTQSLNLNQFSSVFLNEAPQVIGAAGPVFNQETNAIDTQPEQTQSEKNVESFDPFVDLELPKPKE